MFGIKSWKSFHVLAIELFVMFIEAKTTAMKWVMKQRIRAHRQPSGMTFLHSEFQETYWASWWQSSEIQTIALSIWQPLCKSTCFVLDLHPSKASRWWSLSDHSWKTGWKRALWSLWQYWLIEFLEGIPGSLRSDCERNWPWLVWVENNLGVVSLVVVGDNIRGFRQSS